MNNWLEIIDGARSRLPSGLQSLFETSRTEFILATRAQNEIQKATFLVIREWQFATTSIDSGGAITEDTECGAIIEVEYLPTGSLRSGASIISPLPFRSLRGRSRSLAGNGMSAGESVALAYCRYNRQLVFDPFASLSGNIIVTHRPKLLAYSVAAGTLGTGRYANFEAGFDAALAANGPEPEFESYAEAMAAFILKETLPMRPELLSMSKQVYVNALKEWDEAIFNATLDDPPQDTRSEYHPGGIHR